MPQGGREPSRSRARFADQQPGESHPISARVENRKAFAASCRTSLRFHLGLIETSHGKRPVSGLRKKPIQADLAPLAPKRNVHWRKLLMYLNKNIYLHVIWRPREDLNPQPQT